ncbi:MAG: hypothetical protein HC836_09905 [Richelia sp. RM2_1_2]|nr:hypothetical protein [Richelia sp. SM1_7_0]NJN08801.1 hypothetical protein [Richelia sp. RM1_1_1]NJO28750.1 hypothetical protein [Richelia sp. SL_2_1]NJO58643.1 hypothetical protein [Richelia sp. RM2_1_2]
MRLKRWESPRKQGRNDKGKGGAARKRQLKKQQQMLRKRLKEKSKEDNGKNNRQGEEKSIFPHFFCRFFMGLIINRVHLIPVFKN